MTHIFYFKRQDFSMLSKLKDIALTASNPRLLCLVLNKYGTWR